MQKLQSLEDNFKVQGGTFCVQRVGMSFFRICYLSNPDDSSIIPKTIENFYCKSNNIYYIRSRARLIIKNILKEW